MKKILSVLVSCLIFANAHAVIIKAEDTSNQFIRATEQADGYVFTQCKVVQDNEECSPLFNGVKFSRSELNDLSDQNARYALYAAVGDGAAIVGGFVVGLYAGLAFLSYNGAALAAGAFLYGGVPGAATGIAADFAFDDLDPFVHRDTSIAYDAIIGVADSGDLEDVDSFEINDELVVVIEDINFDQLKDKVQGQLADLRDLEINEDDKENSDSGWSLF